MANPEHVEIVRAGAAAIAEWRTANPSVAFDLSKADFSGANLARADLERADLYRAVMLGANLSHANLSSADLLETFLSGADLSHARIADASLSGAALDGAVLRRARIYRSHLNLSNLSGADVAQACLMSTSISGVDLREVRGLESVIHELPCTLGLDTILISDGKIPDEFLRGCGYDPTLQKIILGEYDALCDAAAKSAAGTRGFLLQTCFISYATEDRDFVDRLHADLQKQQPDVAWYAPVRGEAGVRLDDQIDRHISARERTLLVCSKASLARSAWVRHEFEKSREKELATGKAVLFPVMVDDTLLEPTTDPMRLHLRKVLAADFRGATVRRNPAYKEAFKKLLDGLRKEEM